MTVRCPNCGKENQASGVFCGHCSADLVADSSSVQPDAQPASTQSHFPIGKETDVGEGILATAQADGSVHFVFDAKSRRKRAIAFFGIGGVFLTAGLALTVATLSEAITVSPDSSVSPTGVVLFGFLFVLSGIMMLFFARDVQRGSTWIARKGTLVITRSSFGKEKMERFSEGVLSAVFVGGYKSKSFVLVIENRGKRRVVFDTELGFYNEGARLLGQVIARETGLEFLEK